MEKHEKILLLRDVLTREVRRVGEDKALGYILFRVIRKITNTSINDFCNTFKKNQSHVILRKTQTCLRAGAVFVFDEKSMNRILDKYDDVIRKMKWERNTVYVVRKIAKTWFEDDHIVIPMIREMFGDDSWTPPSDEEIELLKNI